LVMRRRRPRHSLTATFVFPFGTRWSELVDKVSEGFANYRRGALSRGFGTLAVRWGRDIGSETRPLIYLFARRRGNSCLWWLIQRGGRGRRRWRGWRRRCPVGMLGRGWLRSVVFLPRVRHVLLLRHPNTLCETLCENDSILNVNVELPELSWQL
jgi:hypothetical protein